MHNLFEKLKKKFSIVMNLRPEFTSNYERMVAEQEGPSDAVPIPEEEPAVAIHMQEEEPVVAVAAPGEIDALLELVLSKSAAITKKNGPLSAELIADANANATVLKVSAGLRRLVELNVITAVTFELKADYASQYANVSASLQAFANASLHFRVDIFNIRAGQLIDVEFNFEAKVAAIATASAEIRIFTIGELGMTVGASAEAYAIAETSVSGKFKIGKDGIEIGGNVKVGATVGVAIEGSASLDINGKKLISLSSKLEASVGAGSEIGGTFTFVDGKLTIKIDFGLTFGAGGTVHENLEVDFDAIKECIQEELEILADKLKAQINAYLRKEMGKIIAQLEEAGDDTGRLLDDPTHIDSELYSEDENVNLEFLRNNKTSRSAWERLKRVKKAGPNRKLVAFQEVIEIAIKLTDKKQP